MFSVCCDSSNTADLWFTLLHVKGDILTFSCPFFLDTLLVSLNLVAQHEPKPPWFSIQYPKLALLFVPPSASDGADMVPSPPKSFCVIAWCRAVWSSCHDLAASLSAPDTFYPSGWRHWVSVPVGWHRFYVLFHILMEVCSLPREERLASDY